MVRSTSRGHRTVNMDGIWLYEDTLTPVDPSRPCARCGKPPTPEGYDACMGFVPGAISACCGHGVSEPILIMED